MTPGGGVDGNYTIVQFGFPKHDEIAANNGWNVWQIIRVIDSGEPFVKVTYNLEGDGPLRFKCYDQIQILKATIEILM